MHLRADDQFHPPHQPTGENAVGDFAPLEICALKSPQRYFKEKQASRTSNRFIYILGSLVVMTELWLGRRYYMSKILKCSCEAHTFHLRLKKWFVPCPERDQFRTIKEASQMHAVWMRNGDLQTMKGHEGVIFHPIRTMISVNTFVWGLPKPCNSV